MRAANDCVHSIKITHFCAQFEFHSFGTIAVDILKIAFAAFILLNVISRAAFFLLIEWVFININSKECVLQGSVTS